MKYLILTLIAALFLSCDNTEGDKKHKYRRSNSETTVLYVNNKPLECISYSTGISCNWLSITI